MMVVDESGGSGSSISIKSSVVEQQQQPKTELEPPIWDYRFNTCGLEEIEVLGESSEALSLIRDQIQDLSSKLGVGFMGNTVKITDIVSYLVDKI